MGDGGKGSSPRPFSVDQKTFDNNWDAMFGQKKKAVEKPNCYCYNCLKDYVEPGQAFPYVMSTMIVCPECGNKRCPHATDHSFACTNSNEPGQPGSRYYVPDDGALTEDQLKQIKESVKNEGTLD